MKKKLQWFVSLVIFSALFLILFVPISEILRAKTNEEIDMVHSFYDVKENTLDVLLLGSSHSYSSFSPNGLWKDYGITSYSMGTPQQSMATSYYLLEEALKRQKPKVVLLESYHFRYKKAYVSEARVRQAFDGVPFSKTKVNMVEELFPDMKFKDKLSFYMPFLKYHSRWSQLQSYDFDSNSYLKGGKDILIAHPFEDPGMVEEGVKPVELTLSYFERIVKLCKKEGIQLVVYAAPIAFEGEDYRKYQGINVWLETYLREKEIPFLFLQKDKELKIDFSVDFFDVGHTNKLGAEKVTAYIGRYLSEELGMPSHAGDAKYVSWDRDYERYMKEEGKKEVKVKR